MVMNRNEALFFFFLKKERILCLTLGTYRKAPAKDPKGEAVV